MTSAELKTLREALGLSVAWVAACAGVQRRTVEYWEAGRMAVPADVEKTIRAIDFQFNHAANQALAVAIENRDKYGKPTTIDIRRYRTDEALWAAVTDMYGFPVTAHAALLDRSRRLLELHGFVVTINYADN
jgi:predicted transcriptional regulator